MKYQTENGEVDMPWWGWIVVAVVGVGMCSLLTGILLGVVFLSSHV